MTVDNTGLRRKADLAVHSICEFAFSVPDIDAAHHFYANFGLDVRRVPDGLELFTYGSAHRWARIFKGEEKKLLWIIFGIDECDYPKFKLRLTKHDIDLVPSPPNSSPDNLWLYGPDDVLIGLAISPKCAPSEKSERNFPSATASGGRAPSRSQIQPVRPTHLSHILLFSSDVPAATDFYINTLGLRMSDKSADIIAFLHGAHGSDHHLLALAKSDGAGLHHSSWNVNSIDEVGLGKQQMAEAGYVKGWGIGRHVLGSNYFQYVRDPWGSYAEYSYDIDFVAHDHEWPAADHPPADSLYVWGPDVPADFICNYETQPKLTGDKS